jgi:hypothetical protein
MYTCCHKTFFGVFVKKSKIIKLEMAQILMKKKMDIHILKVISTALPGNLKVALYLFEKIRYVLYI